LVSWKYSPARLANEAGAAVPARWDSGLIGDAILAHPARATLLAGHQTSV
jgi:hypothetical protein